MRLLSIIGVRDVPDSFKWYQSLFGQPATLPTHERGMQYIPPDERAHPGNRRQILGVGRAGLAVVTSSRAKRKEEL